MIIDHTASVWSLFFGGGGEDPGGLLKYDLGRDVPLRLEK